MKARASLTLAILLATTLARTAHAQEPVTPDRPTQPPIDDASWAERERALDESFTQTGGSGLLRLENATGVAPGQVRVGLVTEGFSAGFLCSPQYPCRNPRTGAAITTDGTGHAGAVLAIGAGLAKLGPGVLEAYLSSGAFTTSDSANSPSLLPSLGDTTLGARYGAPLTRGLALGGTFEMRVSGAGGGVGPDFGSTSARLGAVLSGDLRPVGVPLRAGLNLAYALDNGAHSLAETETARGTTVTRIERFAMNANRVDHVDVRIGAEALLAKERVRPFVEYGLLAPVDRQGYLCRQNNTSSDGCLAITPVVPSTFTLGGRFLPWKHGFSLLVALDIGVTGTSQFIEELAPTPPWMLHAGVGWAFDLRDRPPVIQQAKAPPAPPAPKLARVRGLVHDAAGTAIAGARLRYSGHPELYPLSTGDTGEFGAELAPGEYSLSVDADGYASSSCKVVATTSGPETKTDCALEALPKSGTLFVRLRDLDSGAAVKDARVQLVDGSRALESTSDASGIARFEGLTSAAVKLVTSADRYLVQGGATDIAPRQTTRLEWQLQQRPEKAGVVVNGSKIRFTRPVEFEADGVTLKHASYTLLAELADTLVRRPELHRVEVQVHTDVANDGDKGHARTQEQAESVRSWLVERGVAEDRVVAHGYGTERPLAPNVTAANRARNRRVDVAVLDGEASAAPGASSRLKEAP